MKHGKHMKDYRGGKKKKNPIIKRMFHEVFENEPSTVRRAKVSKKRKRKMKVAIALNKARKAGVRMPKKRKK